MSSEDAVNDIINKVVEGLRKRYVGIQKYSFYLENGGVRRVPDSSGNWIEMSQGHELFDAEVVRSVIEENKIDLSGLMAPVATYDGVEFSRYTLCWVNGAMPEGTMLYAPKSEVEAKRLTTAQMLANIPTADDVQASTSKLAPMEEVPLAEDVLTQTGLDVSSEHHAETTRGRQSC